MAGSSESKLTVSVTKDGDILPIVSCFGAEHEKIPATRKKNRMRGNMNRELITSIASQKVEGGNLELLNLYD
jgi:hypothetical protein